MPLGIQLFEDPRKLKLLERIAVATEGIAGTLKSMAGEQVDPAELAALATDVNASSESLRAAILKFTGGTTPDT